MKEIEEIKEILGGVEETWLANDGGLTAAAVDLVAFGQQVIRAIQRDDLKWLWSMEENCSTGAEQEVTDIGFAYARGKFRRRIEDRLRKDPKFLVKCIDEFLDAPRYTIKNAERPDGKFFQVSVRVDSWNNVPEALQRCFGAENTMGQKWLIDVPIDFDRSSWE